MLFGKHINRYYLVYAPAMLLGLAALIAVDYVQLLIPNLYQMLINGINDGTVNVGGQILPFDLDFLLDRICRPLLGIIVSMVTGRFLWRMLIFGSEMRMENRLRKRMFDHCKNLSREFYQKNKVGSLMSLFTNDVITVRDCFGDAFILFFDAVFLGILAMEKMFRMDWFLTLLSLIPMTLLLCSATIIGKYMTKKWKVRQEAFSSLSDFAQESFSGIAVIKAFVKESKELLAFRKLNRDNEDTNVEYAKISVVFRICVTLFVESVICLILGYGGYLVYKGKFNAGQLVEFISYFNSTVWPVMAVSELIDMSSRGKASLQRISELLDAKQDVVDREDVTPLTEVKGSIEFRNLTFRYPDGEFNALENVSFKIEAGQSVGIVGKTGSGKTTLVDLLLRTYNVPDGTLLIDGHDVNSVPICHVRDACAYVPQDNFLFSDTIENNIAFANSESGEEEIQNSALLADVDENIRGFVKGYKTFMGERGVTVSGGQKQRISIARALLKNAPILILDDSVSAVDTGTEKRILENLRETRKGRTTLLIAHRVSTIEQMDLILYLDGGRLIAAGSHKELLQACPDYANMVHLQKLEEEGGSVNA